MKIRLFAFLTLFSFTLFGQYSAYQKGWHSGWCKGYMKSEDSQVCPPAPPAPPAEAFKETYDDGFARGYSTALSGSNSSSGGNSALIQEGAKKLAASGKDDFGASFGKALESAYKPQPIQHNLGPNDGSRPELAWEVRNRIKAENLERRYKMRSARKSLRLMEKAGLVKNGIITEEGKQIAGFEKIFLRTKHDSMGFPNG